MNVLVVEDDNSIRSVFAEAIEAAGHEAVMAATVREALDLFREHQPDAILLDWMLDGPSADGFLYTLAPHLGQTRVIICTASEAQIPNEIHGVHIAYVLHKPIDLYMIPVALGYKSKAEAEAEWQAVRDHVRTEP